MKMTPEHFEYLKNAITPYDTSTLRAHYKEMNRTDERYRWDLTYIARLSDWISDEVYKYLNDEHIDTALKLIVKPL